MRIALAIVNDGLAAMVKEAVTSRKEEAFEFPDLFSAMAATVDLVFAEWREGEGLYPVLKGLETAAKANLPVVMFVPQGAMAANSRAWEEGAADVLHIPSSKEEISVEIDIAARSHGESWGDGKMYRNIRRDRLVGQHPLFLECLKNMRLAAMCDATVLLLGETGTGKNMFAKAIHDLSRRAVEPFVDFSCANLNESLMGSELFGHVKGAFTSAVANREGLLESVGAGTVFLDEIESAKLPVQTGLLRVLDQRVFSPVGSNRVIHFNARIVCAASEDFDGNVARKEFRKDLRGRIDQFRIILPPLRERASDIPILAWHFLQKHAKGRNVYLGEDAWAELTNYDYPENLRELDNAIVGALARCGKGDVILPEHLDRKLRSPRHRRASGEFTIRIEDGLSYGDTRLAAEREIDRRFLPALRQKHKDQILPAAKEAGIDRKTFVARLKGIAGNGEI